MKYYRNWHMEPATCYYLVQGNSVVRLRRNVDVTGVNVLVTSGQAAFLEWSLCHRNGWLKKIDCATFLSAYNIWLEKATIVQRGSHE